MQTLVRQLKTKQNIFLIGLILFSLVIRIIPILGNNFFFTIDQARDSVYVREIIERHQIIKKGPETTIPGIFVGPLWYYFLAVGYVLSFGHPVGGVGLMILLSLITLAIYVWYFSKKTAWPIAFLSGVLLGVFWPFYNTSRYAFNPFPTVLLSFLLIIFLVEFLEGKIKFYYYGLILIVLLFNSDLASAAVLTIFYALIGVWGVYKKKISLGKYLVFTYAIPGLLSLFVAKQALSIIKNPQSFENARGIFSGTSFSAMFFNFSEIVKVSVFPQSLVVSLILLGCVVFMYVKQKNKNAHISLYSLLTGVLFVICYLFFSTNKGWRDWHTVFLYPLIFTSLFLLASQLKRLVFVSIFVLVFISQSLVFIPYYLQNTKPNSDQSILANQIAIVDWIYSKSEENGFNVYTYMTNSYFDYPYQYLFWWYGKGQYKHVPCHYEVYPKSHKYIYTPGGEFNYNVPTLGCDKLVFLIIEPIKDEERFLKWSVHYENTKLIETTTIGKVTVEKREYIK